MKEDPIYLAHILQALDRIFSYMPEEGTTFFGDFKTQDAVIRNLTVLGEAVKNLSMELRQAHPEIPWKRIAGMRDNLVHKYFGVDLQLVFDTVRVDLPDLRERITAILAGLGTDDSPAPRP